MEFEISKKIKVAFICQFSSEVVQERLPIWKESDVYAAWIANTIEGFKNSKEFEVHIISPHQFLKNDFYFFVFSFQSCFFYCVCIRFSVNLNIFFAI